MNMNRLTDEYEYNANLKMAMICRINMGIFVIVMLLNYFHIFIIDSVIYPVLLFSIGVMFLPTLFYNVFHLHSLIIRYFVLTLVVLMSGILYSFLSYHVIIMLVFPLLVSCLYCDKKSVWYTTILGIPVMIAAHLIAFHLKIVPDEPLITLHGTIFYGILPRLLEYMAIALVCLNMTEKVQNLIQALVHKNQELLAEQEEIITSLSQMVESQSQETGMHVKRVSEYTKILCRNLGYDDDTVWEVGLAAMMHDVGKIMVPHEILEKPGKLTKEEFDIIKKHTTYGKKMLENSPGELMQLSADIAYEHHERYDGTGYDGIKGENIGIFSRCVSVADVFDALTHRRYYKDSWKTEEALAAIADDSGRRFDPDVVQAFMEVKEQILSILAQHPDDEEFSL